MVQAYFLSGDTMPVKGWAALSMGFDDFKGVSVPVLVIYAERDHLPVLHIVSAHKQTLAHPASAQLMLPDTGHFHDDKETEVAELVRDWLDKTL